MPLWIALITFSATVYEREIRISNAAQVVQTDVQIPLDLDLSSLVASGKLDEARSALRFFRGDYPLPCWIDDSSGNLTHRVWIKLDSLIPGEQEITLIYSNFTDGYTSRFDSVFTKARIDNDAGWVFHCDEGEGETGSSADARERLELYDVGWDSGDGGVWGKRQDKKFSAGSAFAFSAGSWAKWNMSPGMFEDSFTVMLWLKLDTLDELTWTNTKRVIMEKSDVFSLWLRNGTIGFSPQNVSYPRTPYLAPFGWERVGEPAIPSAYIPQGLTTVGDKLLLSAYRKNPLDSRVWMIDPRTLEILEWFDMPGEATHTSGLAYDSTRGSVWAVDYDSGEIYEIALEKSFLNHHAMVKGKFPLGEEGASACCLVTVNDTVRLLVSIFKASDARTYVLDGPASIEREKAVVLSSYLNVGSSQGLAFDGTHMWEAGTTLAEFDLSAALEQGDYRKGIVSRWPQVPLPEGITFISDTLWAINEYWGRDFFKLSGDPREHLGKWMHLAVTYDGLTLSLYGDGELAHTLWVGPRTGASEALPLYVGGLEAGKSSFMGSIDEIALLYRASNPDEIQAHFERRTPLATRLEISVAEDEDASSGDETLSRFIDSLGIETSSSTLRLKVPYEKNIAIALYDVSGRKVATILAPQKVRGRLELSWPSGIPAGVYHVMVSSEGFHASRKVVILR